MYNKFYGFSEKPFELTPDPRFLYLTPSHREALDSMIDGIRNRKGFISITGEVGTGKTTLIHSLLNSLDEKVKTVYIFHPTITFKELLETIFLELDLKVVERSKTALLFRLAKYLTQMDADETIAVIIDEAQNLPEEMMKEIQVFSDLEPKTIQIGFVGQPEFEDKLNSEGLRQLKQRIGSSHQIGALSKEESKNYIDHRLRLVGSSSSQMFTPKALSMVCSYARGIPRIINVLCDNAFLRGYSLSQKKIDADIIEEVIKNLEGPRVTPKILPSIQPIRQFWRSPIRFAISFKRGSLAIFVLVCLGGLIFLLYEYIGRGSVKIQEKKPLTGQKLATEPSTYKHSAQGTIKEILEKDTNPTDQGKITQTESSSLQRDAALPTPAKEKEQFTEVIVKRGETLLLLAKNYYHIANLTLIDVILQSNPEITNANHIKVGQKIRIRKITEESLVSQSSDHTFKIHVGTFWSPELSKLYRDEPALKGKTIEVIPLKIIPTEILHRVKVGNFQNRDEALNMVFFLKKKGLLPCFGSGPKTD